MAGATLVAVRGDGDEVVVVPTAPHSRSGFAMLSGRAVIAEMPTCPLQFPVVLHAAAVVMLPTIRRVGIMSVSRECVSGGSFRRSVRGKTVSNNQATESGATAPPTPSLRQPQGPTAPGGEGESRCPLLVLLLGWHPTVSTR